MPLRFYDAGNVVVTKDSWIDDVKLALVTPSGGNLVANGGFETPVLAANSHNNNPAGSGWRFTVNGAGAGAGIDRGNPYGTSIPNSVAEAGQQMAYLRGSGAGNGTTSIEQDTTGFVVGKSYVLSFQVRRHRRIQRRESVLRFDRRNGRDVQRRPHAGFSFRQLRFVLQRSVCRQRHDDDPAVL